jgi:predicted Zn-dependent protease
MKRNFSLLLLALVLVCNASFAQILGSPDVIRMTQAKNRFSEGDYNGALAVYLQLYTAHGANPLLNFRMAECYLVLKQGKDALAYVDKARELDANVDKELEYHAARGVSPFGQARGSIGSPRSVSQAG